MCAQYSIYHYHHHHHLSLNCEGHLGTTDDFATSFLHFSLFSNALWDLANSRPVHFLMLSSLMLWEDSILMKQDEFAMKWLAYQDLMKGT